MGATGTAHQPCVLSIIPSERLLSESPESGYEGEVCPQPKEPHDLVGAVDDLENDDVAQNEIEREEIHVLHPGCHVNGQTAGPVE